MPVNTNVNNNSAVVVVGRTAPVPTGQQSAAKSIPVVVASDQEAIPVEEQNKQQYEIKIDSDNVSDFAPGDLVTLKEHATTYGLPANLTVVDFGFAEQSFTLILSFTGGFNNYHGLTNVGSGWSPTGNGGTGELTVTSNARGYIEKKRSFTIAKGIIGVE